jgi:hypothetical protein
MKAPFSELYANMLFKDEATALSSGEMYALTPLSILTLFAVFNVMETSTLYNPFGMSLMLMMPGLFVFPTIGTTAEVVEEVNCE